jgi:hypothetical protein
MVFANLDSARSSIWLLLAPASRQVFRGGIRVQRGAPAAIGKEADVDGTALEPARRESLKWLVNFKTKIGLFSQCPRCAGTYSQQSNLEPTGYGTEKMDTFKCRVCGLEKAHVFSR